MTNNINAVLGVLEKEVDEWIAGKGTVELTLRGTATEQRYQLTYAGQKLDAMALATERTPMRKANKLRRRVIIARLRHKLRKYVES